MIVFILVVQNSDLENVTFSEVVVYKTLYVFIHARDCSEALQIVQLFKLDFFLIEENLPMISGLEFSTSLSAQPRMGQVPTIIFDACYTTIAQKKKMFSPDETSPTIPHVEILLEIIDKMLLFPGHLLLTSFSMH